MFLEKKETLAQVFSYEFCEISKNTFFTEHLWAIALVNLKNDPLNSVNTAEMFLLIVQ